MRLGGIEYLCYGSWGSSKWFLVYLCSSQVTPHVSFSQQSRRGLVIGADCNRFKCLRINVKNLFERVPNWRNTNTLCGQGVINLFPKINGGQPKAPQRRPG